VKDEVARAREIAKKYWSTSKSRDRTIAEHIDETAALILAERRDVLESLSAAQSFKFWGPSATRGDYVLVTYYDEDDKWWVEVFKLGSQKDRKQSAYSSRDEALMRARKLASK
jgi:hypothetical protein